MMKLQSQRFYLCTSTVLLLLQYAPTAYSYGTFMGTKNLAETSRERAGSKEVPSLHEEDHGGDTASSTSLTSPLVWVAKQIQSQAVGLTRAVGPAAASQSDSE